MRRMVEDQLYSGRRDRHRVEVIRPSVLIYFDAQQGRLGAGRLRPWLPR